MSLTLPIAPRRLVASRPAGATVPSASAHRRLDRVLLFVIGLSLLDLVVTLAWMTGPGMIEDNPLVLWLAAVTGSPLAIAGWKMLTVVIAVGTLHRLRGTWQAEAGAWLMLAILIAVYVQWVGYSAVVAEIAAIDPSMLPRGGAGFVTL